MESLILPSIKSSRPHTTSNTGKTRIGYSAAQRPRIKTAKPIFHISDPSTRPTTSESTYSAADKIESEIKQNMSLEFEGLNASQRDALLQTLYQTQVVRDKYNAAIKNIEYTPDEDDLVLECLEIPTFPVDDANGETIVIPATTPAPVQEDSVKPVKKPRPYSHSNLVDPSIEADSIAEKGDRIDADYTLKIKKMSSEIQKWVEATLESSVDLEEYIAINITGTGVPKKEPPRPESASKPIPSNVGFQAELESALTSWKPQFLSSKKGKLLNVIAESMAPGTVLSSLSQNYKTKFKNKSLMRDPALVISSPTQKHIYGRWYIPPDQWQTQMLKQKNGSRRYKQEKSESFVVRRLREINEEMTREMQAAKSVVSKRPQNLHRIRIASIAASAFTTPTDRRTSVSDSRVGTAASSLQQSSNGSRRVSKIKRISVPELPLPFGKSGMTLEGSKRASFFKPTSPDERRISKVSDRKPSIIEDGRSLFVS